MRGPGNPLNVKNYIDIFEQKISYQEKSNKSFIVIQEEIIAHYIKWVNSAMHLDFGQAYSYPPTSILSLVSSKILISSKLIMFSLIIALIFCAGCVGFARINENAHNLKQVYLGFLLGVFIEFFIFYF